MRARAVMVATVLLFHAATVDAQAPRKPNQTRVEQLQKRVDEALKASADVPSLLKSVQQLQEELRQLRQQLGKSRTVTREFKALRDKLDQLDHRLGDMELRLSALALQAASKPIAGYDDGFFLRSRDDRFLLKFRGLLQGAYFGRVVSERRQLQGTRIGEHRSGYQINHARLIAQGHTFHPSLGYMIAVDFGRLGPPATILDAYVQLRWHRMLNIRLGLMRTPFGRQYALPLRSMTFIERSPVTFNFYPGRDLGLKLYGEVLSSRRFGTVSYQVGMYNGGGPAVLDDNNLDFLYAARVVYEPLGPLANSEREYAVLRRPHVAIGGSFFFTLAPTDAAIRAGETDTTKIAQLRDQDQDGEVDNVAIYSAAGELAVHWFGFNLQGELFYRREDPGAVSSSRTFWGTYDQLGWYHSSTGLEGAVRYGYWQVQRYGDVSKRADELGGANGKVIGPTSVHEIAGVFNTWLLDNRIKLQAQYAHRWLRNLADLSGKKAADKHLRAHRITVQVQFAF